jgi:hypothetical protein
VGPLQELSAGATKRVEQRVNERADTLIRNANFRISRVERKQEEHLQDYNKTEKRKLPLITHYFRLKKEILEGVMDPRSNATNRLQKQLSAAASSKTASGERCGRS